MIKKFIVFTLILIVMISLVGCGNQTSKPTPTPVPTETKQSEDISEPIIIDNNESSKETAKSEPTVYFTWANWTDNAQMFEEAINYDKLMMSSERHFPVHKFNTSDDLDLFRNKFSDLDFDWADSYSNVYFEDNVLILAYVTSGSSSVLYGLRDLKYTDDGICLNIEQTNNPLVGTTDMAGWFVVLEMSRTESEKYNSYDSKFVGISENAIKEKDIVTLPGMIEYGEFSYDAVLESTDLNAPTVQTSGFANTEEVMIEGFSDAIERAKLEATIDYDLLQTFYDNMNGIWKVDFWNSKMAGGTETVYLNNNGITLLIVYGE